MRVTRIVSVLVALVLAAALPVLVSGSATAAGEKQAAAAAAAKTRDITFQFRAKGRTYKFQGTVKPRSKSKNISVKLLRANCKKCKYRTFKSTRTNNRGKYDFSGLKKTGWFTIKVPASKGFKTSYANKSIRVFIT